MVSRMNRHSFLGAGFGFVALLAATATACGGSSTSSTSSKGGSGDDGGTAAAGEGGAGSSSGTGGSSGSSSGTGGSSGSSSGTGGSSGSSSGTGSSSGSGGSSGSSGSSSGGTADASSCAAKGSEVVMIGDSYFALSESTSPPAGEITQHLQGLASAAGALASGDAYRFYYKSGANMATYPTSFVTPIPSQFGAAVNTNPDIRYVIMDGGGNDILLQNTSCISVAATTPISDACKTDIQNTIDTANKLFATMKTAGVQKIIYFFYPHLPTTTYPSVNVVMDYAYPLVKAACDASPIPCYFIDTRPAFDGKDAQYIGPDNIHPTTAGSDVIAGLIWQTMQQECVALSP